MFYTTTENNKIPDVFANVQRSAHYKATANNTKYYNATWERNKKRNSQNGGPHVM